jgi:hypothetical protein
VAINLKAWARRSQDVERICSALSVVEAGYLREGIYSTNTKVSARVVRKLFQSLTYFRRSFRVTADIGEAYVNLAVAFETLLTDSYAKGVQQRIKRRLKVTLKGVKGNRDLNLATKDLYTARSQIVHAGTTDIEVDVSKVRRAFTHSFLFIVEHLSSLPASTNEPIKVLVGE